MINLCKTKKLAKLFRGQLPHLADFALQASGFPKRGFPETLWVAHRPKRRNTSDQRGVGIAGRERRSKMSGLYWKSLFLA